MNYDDAMEFIYSTSWMGSILGISRMKTLMEKLGNPQDKVPNIHIAGTNGKGSTAAMLASILTSAGYRTGLYTSPVIHYFGERMMIDTVPMPEADITKLTAKMKEAADTMDEKPTEYELITALSYLYFAEAADIGVIETGLGGTLDATNVIDRPILSIITAIGMDHTKELGNSLDKITEQKAGIIKKGCPVVLSAQGEIVTKGIEAIAKEKEAPLFISEAIAVLPAGHDLDLQHFSYHGELYSLSLLGEYQLENVATVLKAVEVLRTQGIEIPDEAVHKGLQTVRWPGRFEILRKSPTAVLDGAHNPQGAESFVRNVKAYFPGKKLTVIVGILADKEYHTVVEILSQLTARWIAVTPNSDRALEASELAVSLQRYHADVRIIDSVTEALDTAMQDSGPDDVICVLGTLTLIGEVRSYFHLL